MGQDSFRGLFLSIFIFSLLFLCACGKQIYTIKNNYKESIIAGSVVLTPTQCVEFLDFPVIGDFPIKFRYKDRELFFEKSYPPAHYIVSEQGEILKQNQACKIEVVKERPSSGPSDDSTDTGRDGSSATGAGTDSNTEAGSSNPVNNQNPSVKDHTRESPFSPIDTYP